ncbi:MAG TPA: N-formylglutamate amidohydrolase [Beijerinckiaceae bacterium]|nr:N-formylglutamate amidohydrolase [Beijerinckiaceae bacterium]
MPAMPAELPPDEAGCLPGCSEFDPPFELVEPVAVSAPVLFNSPHSGVTFPPSFLAQTPLSQADLCRSADLHVDRFLDGPLALGMSVLRVNIPRSFLDLNREAHELDPTMFAGRLPPPVNSGSLRVSSGYGTIPRLVAEGVAIYRRPLPVAEALRRIDCYYRPYHRLLATHLARLRQAFGSAILIDCHSMPSHSGGHALADIVLGNRNGRSCSPELMRLAFHWFESLGLSVACNTPYAGGFITEHYGKPGLGQHALQIEVHRALYMDEKSYVPHEGLARLADAMTGFAARLVDYFNGQERPAPQWAAE